MTTGTDRDTLRAQVMTGLDRIFDGDAEYVNALPEIAQNLVLIMSARAMAQFCDDNEGRHEAWGVDADAWARWIAHCRGIVAKADALLGPWFAAWIGHRASSDAPQSPRTRD